MVKTPDATRFPRELAEMKQKSTLQALFKAARLLNEVALNAARLEYGNAELRASHTALLPHIDLAGTRLSTLAERLGVTKQAVGQLVDDLERLGTVERVTDLEDGRAKLIRFTRAGERQLLLGLKLLGRIELELERELGQRRVRDLAKTLALVLDFAASKLDTRQR